MRRWAFAIAIFGMLVLAGVFFFDVREVDSLEGLEVNQKVMLRGIVIDERSIYGVRILKLDNGIELRCECAGDFLKEYIEVEGVVLESGQVEILEIY